MGAGPRDPDHGRAPSGVETLGGFVVWDAGLYLTLILGAWALTAATRVLRGDEEAGRTTCCSPDHPGGCERWPSRSSSCSGPAPPSAWRSASRWPSRGPRRAERCSSAAAAVGYCAVVVGFVGLARRSSPPGPARWGAARISARRRGSCCGRAPTARTRAPGLGWLSPLGWTDQLRAFGDNRWPVLLVPLAVLLPPSWAAATAVQERRDTGAGLLAGRVTHRSRSWGLGSPVAFAWRADLAVLLAWGAGVSVAGMVVGVLLPSVDEYLGSDVWASATSWPRWGWTPTT